MTFLASRVAFLASEHSSSHQGVRFPTRDCPEVRGIVFSAVVKILSDISLASTSAVAGFIILEAGRLFLKSNKFSGVNFHFFGD